MTKRQPPGNSKGGQFAPDPSGKKAPSTQSVPPTARKVVTAAPDPVKVAHEAYAKTQPVRNGHQFAPEGECSYCDQQYEEGNSFFPPHRKERSRNCGGGSNFHHCTCSACF